MPPLDIVAVAGMSCSVYLYNYSNNVELPRKYVYVSSLSSAYDSPWESNTGAQYLGGDAYNYIVEASLKAGYYNAVSNEKTITMVGSILLFFISAYVLIKGLLISIVDHSSNISVTPEVKAIANISDNDIEKICNAISQITNTDK